MGMRRGWFRLIPGFLVGCTFFFLLSNVTALPAGEPDSGMPRNPCEECHPDVTASFRSDIHARAWSDQSGGAGGKRVCESCHGPADMHLEEGSRENIITFSRESGGNAEAQTRICLNCHRGSTGLGALGKHADENVACAQCHTVHRAKTSAAPQPSRVCFRCHREVRLQNSKRSRHPIREGKVTCGDCHNPHGTLTPGMIRADSLNELCYRCHAGKRGPFLWEHPPVEENCGTCHRPHGSVYDSLLVYRIPNLCQDCHGGPLHVGYPYDAGSGFGSRSRDAGSRLFVGRSCLNCHSNVHGSTAPGNPSHGENSGSLFLR